MVDKDHHQKLISRRDQLNRLILIGEKTLAYNKGEIEMSNKEKFEGFKKEKLAENESKYGKEIREKYGNEAVEKLNQKFLNLSEEDFNNMKQIESEMFEDLEKVIITQDLDSDIAKTVYEKHRDWLCYSWPKYSPEAHIGLGEMYVADERFAKYYNDKKGPKAATTLRDIISKYAK